MVLKHPINRSKAGWTVVFLSSLLLPVLVSTPVLAADSTEAAAIFGKRCTACHTFGKGIRVGPDLKGVTERRKREWLLKFIHSSQSVIQAKDPIAVALFQQFKQQRMPDWTDLSPQQINAILDYFAVDGPEQKPANEKDAAMATSGDINQGRKLFNGELRFTAGGQPCGTCHSIKDSRVSHGGTLGPDLTSIYFKYQDKALTSFLRRPCIPRVPELYQDSFLTPQESFDLKAYLLQTAKAQAGTTGQSHRASSTNNATSIPEAR